MLSVKRRGDDGIRDGAAHYFMTWSIEGPGPRTTDTYKTIVNRELQSGRAFLPRNVIIWWFLFIFAMVNEEGFVLFLVCYFVIFLFMCVFACLFLFVCLFVCFCFWWVRMCFPACLEGTPYQLGISSTNRIGKYQCEIRNFLSKKIVRLCFADIFPQPKCKADFFSLEMFCPHLKPLPMYFQRKWCPNKWPHWAPGSSVRSVPQTSKYVICVFWSLYCRT